MVLAVGGGGGRGSEAKWMGVSAGLRLRPPLATQIGDGIFIFFKLLYF